MCSRSKAALTQQSGRFIAVLARLLEIGCGVHGRSLSLLGGSFDHGAIGSFEIPRCLLGPPLHRLGLGISLFGHEQQRQGTTAIKATIRLFIVFTATEWHRMPFPSLRRPSDPG